jgi:hypothetical protein
VTAAAEDGAGAPTFLCGPACIRVRSSSSGETRVEVTILAAPPDIIGVNQSAQPVGRRANTAGEGEREWGAGEGDSRRRISSYAPIYRTVPDEGEGMKGCQV